jgi:transcriptional regulator with XRE-family HTH domain
MPLTETPGNGAAVRVARAVRNLSQVELAKLTGLPNSRIFQIEHGLARPTPEEWCKIWNALTSE